jgi:chemotaxis protein methyltransferase CheR
MPDENINLILLDKTKKNITEYTGLVMLDRDHKKLLNAIIHQATLQGFTNPNQYLESIFKINKEIYPHILKLVSQMVNLESYFFRDKVQCELLKNTILPKIIEKNKSIRIWSAGCSRGEEAFTIAIMIHQLLPKSHNYDITIIGTDISPHAISSAKSGLFNEYSFRNTLDSIKNQYFTRNKDDWQINDTLRKSVYFFEGNLIADQYPSSSLNLHDFNLILCRNVFIYFDKKKVLNVVKKFSQSLLPGGLLLTGPAELYLIEDVPLAQEYTNNSLVYKKVFSENEGHHSKAI